MHRPRTSFLPSITQVLENGCHQPRPYCEGSSSVLIWVDPVHLMPVSRPTSTKRPQTPLARLMKTIDIQGAQPAQEGVEHFSYVVCFPDEAEDDAESSADFVARRPNTSRGFRFASVESNGPYSNDFIKDKFLLLTKGAQKLIPTAMAEALLRRRLS